MYMYWVSYRGRHVLGEVQRETCVGRVTEGDMYWVSYRERHVLGELQRETYTG